MPTIDPTARVEDGAVLGDGVAIGPFCMVGKDVRIGPNCRLVSHVTVMGHTSIAADCVMYPFASLGGPPQDLSYRDEPTRLEIGAGCTIREGVTMNVGTVKGGGLTQVGARGFFMNNSHVGHDCVVGNDVIFATSATLGGHCDIGDHVYLGGLTAVHQHSRIGAQAMVGGVCGVTTDVIPYAIVNGQRATLRGLNFIGMKRRKFTRERIAIIRQFYQKLFHGPGLFTDRLADVARMEQDDPAVGEILAFIRRDQHRPLCLPPKSEAAGSRPS